MLVEFEFRTKTNLQQFALKLPVNLQILNIRNSKELKSIINANWLHLRKLCLYLGSCFFPQIKKLSIFIFNFQFYLQVLLIQGLRMSKLQDFTKKVLWVIFTYDKMSYLFILLILNCFKDSILLDMEITWLKSGINLKPHGSRTYHCLIEKQQSLLWV